MEELRRKYRDKKADDAARLIPANPLVAVEMARAQQSQALQSSQRSGRVPTAQEIRAALNSCPPSAFGRSSASMHGAQQRNQVAAAGSGQHVTQQVASNYAPPAPGSPPPPPPPAPVVSAPITPTAIPGPARGTVQAHAHHHHQQSTLAETSQPLYAQSQGQARARAEVRAHSGGNFANYQPARTSTHGGHMSDPSRRVQSVHASSNRVVSQHLHVSQLHNAIVPPPVQHIVVSSSGSRVYNTHSRYGQSPTAPANAVLVNATRSPVEHSKHVHRPSETQVQMQVHNHQVSQAQAQVQSTAQAQAQSTAQARAQARARTQSETQPRQSRTQVHTHKPSRGNERMVQVQPQGRAHVETHVQGLVQAKGGHSQGPGRTQGQSAPTDNGNEMYSNSQGTAASNGNIGTVGGTPSPWVTSLTTQGAPSGEPMTVSRPATRQVFVPTQEEIQEAREFKQKVESLGSSLGQLWDHPVETSQIETPMLHRLRAILAFDSEITRSKMATWCGVSYHALNLYLRGLLSGDKTQEELEKKVSIWIGRSFYSPEAVALRKKKRNAVTAPDASFDNAQTVGVPPASAAAAAAAANYNTQSAPVSAVPAAPTASIPVPATTNTTMSVLFSRGYVAAASSVSAPITVRGAYTVAGAGGAQARNAGSHYANRNVYTSAARASTAQVPGRYPWMQKSVYSTGYQQPPTYHPSQLLAPRRPPIRIGYTVPSSRTFVHPPPSTAKTRELVRKRGQGAVVSSVQRAYVSLAEGAPRTEPTSGVPIVQTSFSRKWAWDNFNLVSKSEHAAVVLPSYPKTSAFAAPYAAGNTARTRQPLTQTTMVNAVSGTPVAATPAGAPNIAPLPMGAETEKGKMMVSDILYYQKLGFLWIDEDGVSYEKKFGNPYGKFKKVTTPSRPRKRRRRSELASKPAPTPPAVTVRKTHSRYSFRRMVTASPQSRRVPEVDANADANDVNMTDNNAENPNDATPGIPQPASTP